MLLLICLYEGINILDSMRKTAMKQKQKGSCFGKLKETIVPTDLLVDQWPAGHHYGELGSRIGGFGGMTETELNGTESF